MNQNINIYALYTSEDKEIMDDLLSHLKSDKEEYNLVIWHDDPIDFGQKWKSTDIARLDNTDIFLLLISNSFMYSEFIKQLEFKKVIDRYKGGESMVIPVIIDECPWDIDFEAQEYTFSFKELQVLPEDGKPVVHWQSTDQALEKSAVEIRKSISSLIQSHEQGKTGGNEAAAWNNKIEDQLALSFSEEAQAKQKEKEALRLREVAEAERRAQEKSRLIEEAKVKRRIQEENWLRERMEERPEPVMVGESEHHEEKQLLPIDNRAQAGKKVIIGVSIAALFLVGLFLLFPDGTNDLEQSLSQAKEEVLGRESNTVDEPSNESSSTLGAGASLSKFDIGDKYEGGIIFEIDDSGKKGMVAHTEDAGPMIWNDAMKIHEQLGEGWRLPTMEELKLMHATIGQGATNSGEFTDGLYWSATPYDSNQARLVRFQDGNTTFHYNSIGTFREFPVRAVRDFDE